jgi:hypothetical protein
VTLKQNGVKQVRRKKKGNVKQRLRVQQSHTMVFLMETHSVLCKVQTENLNADMHIDISFQTARELHEVTACQFTRLHGIFDVCTVQGSPTA